MHTQMQTDMHTWTHRNTHKHRDTHRDMYTQRHRCTHKHIGTHTGTHSRTHTETQTQTHTYARITSLHTSLGPSDDHLHDWHPCIRPGHCCCLCSLRRQLLGSAALLPPALPARHPQPFWSQIPAGCQVQPARALMHQSHHDMPSSLSGTGCDASLLCGPRHMPHPGLSRLPQVSWGQGPSRPWRRHHRGSSSRKEDLFVG